MEGCLWTDTHPSDHWSENAQINYLYSRSRAHLLHSVQPLIQNEHCWKPVSDPASKMEKKEQFFSSPKLGRFIIDFGIWAQIHRVLSSYQQSVARTACLPWKTMDMQSISGERNFKNDKYFRLALINLFFFFFCFFVYVKMSNFNTHMSECVAQLLNWKIRAQPIVRMNFEGWNEKTECVGEMSAFRVTNSAVKRNFCDKKMSKKKGGQVHWLMINCLLSHKIGITNICYFSYN